jgi:hypothetical protein
MRRNLDIFGVERGGFTSENEVSKRVIHMRKVIFKSKTTKELRRETREVIGLTSLLILIVIFGMTALT